MVQNIIQNSKCDEIVSACGSAEKPCHVSSAPSHNAPAPTLSNIPYPILFAVSCYNISWTMDTNEGPPYSLHSTFTSLHAAADAVLQLPVWWRPVDAPLNQLKLISILWCSVAILLPGWLVLLLFQSNPKYWQENEENSIKMDKKLSMRHADVMCCSRGQGGVPGECAEFSFNICSWQPGAWSLVSLSAETITLGPTGCSHSHLCPDTKACIML